MANKTTYKVPFRRRKEGKTNYKKRLSMLKGRVPRLVVRKTNKYVIVQVIEYLDKGDKTIAHANSRELEKFGWKAGKKNLPAAYLTGLLAGSRAKKANVKNAILDIGFASPQRKGWWSSALKGAMDTGLKIPAGEEAMPDENRIKGKHIEDFAKIAKGKSFGKINETDLKNTTKIFEEVKQKILGSK